MINIGNDAVEAIKELRGNSNFVRMLEALEVVLHGKVFEAGSSPVDQRVNQTAYAAGMYDLWKSLRSTYDGQHPSQMKSTPIKKAPAYAQ